MRRTPLVLAGAALGVVAAAVVVHHARHGVAVQTPDGILLSSATTYDRLAGRLLGGFYAGVARDVAGAAPAGAHVLDVGCGPGHVASHLVTHGLAVTGIDLDPAMITRARLRLGPAADLHVADVAALPFEDASFDLVVSTLSMHHWPDPGAGLAEMARVVRLDGVILVYDVAADPFHGHVHNPLGAFDGASLRVVSQTPWRWPGPLSFTRRTEARPA